MNRFPRPAPARARVVTMGMALRLALAVLIAATTIAIWIVNDATGWSPIPASFEAPDIEEDAEWA